MNSYFIPGVGGSVLSYNGTQLYPSTTGGIGLAAAQGRLDYLICDGDGNSVYPITVEGLFSDYQALNDCLGTTPLTYDFRLSPVAIARQLLPQIQGPCVIVAHSAGNLVASALQDLLIRSGRPNDIVGMVDLAGPLSYQNSNWSQYEMFLGKGTVWEQVTAAIFAGNLARLLLPLVSPLAAALYLTWRQQSPLAQSLLEILSTWDMCGVLLPSDRRVRSQDWWRQLNPNLHQDYLNRTLAIKETLSHVSLPQYICYYGQGHRTPIGLDLTGNPSAPPGSILQYSQDGDSTVAFREQPPNPGQTPPIAIVATTADHTEIGSHVALCDSIKQSMRDLASGTATPMTPAVEDTGAGSVNQIADSPWRYRLEPLPEYGLIGPPLVLQQLPPPSKPNLQPLWHNVGNQPLDP